MASRAGSSGGWGGGADAPGDPEPQCDARQWGRARGPRLSDISGRERIEQSLSWHQIATEEEFGEALRFAATLIPVERVRSALLGAGAPWRWPHLQAACPTGKEILAYYPCAERVHHVAQLQYAVQNQRAGWIEATMVRLNFGEVASVIGGLPRMAPASVEAEAESRKLSG